MSVIVSASCFIDQKKRKNDRIVGSCNSLHLFFNVGTRSIGESRELSNGAGFSKRKEPKDAKAQRKERDAPREKKLDSQYLDLYFFL